MRLLGYFAGACVALALLQAAIKLAVLLVLLGCFVAFVRHPRETIALIVTVGVLNLVALYPVASITIMGAIAAAKALPRWRTGGSTHNSNTEAVRRITHESQSERD